jgi:tubulin polyglutamylase TTLL6/13
MEKNTIPSITKDPKSVGVEDNSKEGKPMIVANLRHTHYRVLREVMENEMGWKVTYEAEDDAVPSSKEWDLFWHDISIGSELLARLKPFQKANHFPGMESLARKDFLCKNLTRMRTAYSKDYSFFPLTWLLPSEWSEFKKQFTGKPKTFIVKPEAASQGRGIFLVRNWTSIHPGERSVVQRYINKPYLIDGLKFDLRIYVLIYGCDPFRLFLYKEGLARLATEQYVAPKGKNMKNQFIHLTNYAINKINENYEFNTTENNASTGHKRSLKFVWDYIRKNGGNPNKVKKKIKKCIIKTFCAVHPYLSRIYKEAQPNDFANNKCFEILGFDILIDHKLKPWLLEVNHAPSFNVDSPFDHKVKSELLKDTFRLLRMDPEKRLKYYRKQSTDHYRIFPLKLSKEERDQKKVKKMAKRDLYEANNLGGYEIIYPSKSDMNKYDSYIKTATDLWDSYNSIKKKFPSIIKKETGKKIVKLQRKVKTHKHVNKLTLSRTDKALSKNKRTAAAKANTSGLVVTPSLDVSRKKQLPKTIPTQNPPDSSNSESCSLESDESTEEVRMPAIAKEEQAEPDTQPRQSKSFIVSRREPEAYNFAPAVNGNTVERPRMAPVLYQALNYGAYIVPKVIEFAPMDSLKMPTLPKKRWMPSKVYRPNVRYQRESYTRGYE